jgi:hypothetical protein
VEIVRSASGAPGNYDFRIFLAGYPVICDTQNWAYVNTTDVNYSSIVASVLSARAMGSTVTLHVIQDSKSYCVLGYMDVY